MLPCRQQPPGVRGAIAGRVTGGMEEGSGDLADPDDYFKYYFDVSRKYDLYIRSHFVELVVVGPIWLLMTRHKTHAPAGLMQNVNKQFVKAVLCPHRTTAPEKPSSDNCHHNCQILNTDGDRCKLHPVIIYTCPSMRRALQRRLPISAALFRVIAAAHLGLRCFSFAFTALPAPPALEVVPGSLTYISHCVPGNRRRG